MYDNRFSTGNVPIGTLPVDTNKKNKFSIASFVLAAAPIAVLLLTFIVCFIFSGGGFSDNDMGAIWWLFIAMIWIVGMAAIITNILSVIFGILGLIKKKTVFAWVGIIIVSLEVLAVLAVLLIWG